MHKCKCGMYFTVILQIVCIDPSVSNHSSQHLSKKVAPNFSHKCSLLSKFLQHRQNIAWRPTRISLHHHIALPTESILRKIYEQLSECNHIKSLHDSHPPYNKNIYVPVYLTVYHQQRVHETCFTVYLYSTIYHR